LESRVSDIYQRRVYIAFWKIQLTYPLILFYCSWAGANGHLYMYILAAGTLPLDSEVMARKERSYGHQIAVERTG